MLEVYLDHSRSYIVDLIPVMESWAENCTIRQAMGMCCKFNCVPAAEEAPLQGRYCIF
jgi:hypothetical protein